MPGTTDGNILIGKFRAAYAEQLLQPNEPTVAAEAEHCHMFFSKKSFGIGIVEYAWEILEEKVKIQVVLKVKKEQYAKVSYTHHSRHNTGKVKDNFGHITSNK